MSPRTPTPHSVRAAAAGLARVSEAMADDLGSLPTLAELLEVLGWGVPTGGEHLQRMPAPPVKITAKVRGRASGSSGPSRVSDLNDAAFAKAADLMADVARIEGSTSQVRPRSRSSWTC